MILFSTSFDARLKTQLETMIAQCYSKPTFRALLAVPTFQRATFVLDELERNFKARNVSSARIDRHRSWVVFSNGSRIQVTPLVGHRSEVYLKICSQEFDDVIADASHYGQYLGLLREVEAAILARKRPRSDKYFHEARGPLRDIYKQVNQYLEKKPMNETIDKDVLKRNKFYVGSPKALRDNWGKATLADATKHAEERLEATGEAQFIVKIVRVVRRKKPPVVIEEVR